MIGLKMPPSRSMRIVPDEVSIGMGNEEESSDRLMTLHDLPTRRKHIPLAACAFGRRGEGKTLWITTQGRQLQRRFEIASLPFKVYSNYHTTFADLAYQEIVEDLQEFPKWLDDSPYSVLLIDEIAELLPSMRPTSNNNLLTMSFLKQIRKRGVTVIAATQFPQETTVGVLRQCDFFIRCRSLRGGRAVATYWWDWPGNITGNWGRKYWPPEPGTEDWSKIYHNTDAMWGTYDTDEIVAPHHSDRREQIRAEQAYRQAGMTGERMDNQPAVAEPAETPVLDHLPAALRTVFLDAQGGASGVVFLSQILEPLQRHFGASRARVEEIAGRLKLFGFTPQYDDASDEVYVTI